MAQALRVALEMASALFVGGAIGWFLDRWLGTRPWLLLVFLLLGVAAGILNAYRAATRNKRRGEQVGIAGRAFRPGAVAWRNLIVLSNNSPSSAGCR